MKPKKLDWYVQGTYDDIPQHDISGPHEHYQLALAWLEGLFERRQGREWPQDAEPRIEADEEGREVAWTYQTPCGKYVYYRLRPEARRKRQPTTEPSEVYSYDELSQGLSVGPESGPVEVPAPTPARLRRPRRLDRQPTLAL